MQWRMPKIYMYIKFGLEDLVTWLRKLSRPWIEKKDPRIKYFT